MKFAVIGADYRNIFRYNEILLKYNAKQKTIVEQYDGEEVYNYYLIEINSIEELITLQKELKQKIIITDSFTDRVNWNDYNILTIVIYDNYIE